MDRGAIQKKQLIIEKAAEVFAQKGFLKVTMKDIVEACGISRGGLYRYYGSTAQIFLEAAEQEMRDKQVSFAEKIEEDATNKEVIALFLKQEKETVLKGRLNKAMYEFYSENKVSGRENILHRQRAYQTKILEKLIGNGVENGEFFCRNPKREAEHMTLALAGLRAGLLTGEADAEILDDEIAYLLDRLV